jgi:hypothetical protein
MRGGMANLESLAGRSYAGRACSCWALSAIGEPKRHSGRKDTSRYTSLIPE